MITKLTPQQKRWMDLAFIEADRALEEDEVPVGAVIVRDGRILGRGHNRMRSLTDPTAHAEILAITAACETTGDVRLDGADIYCTLEPCTMCSGALVLARVKRLYYAAADERTGACESLYDIVRDPRLNHQLEVYGRVDEDRSKQTLQEFFNKHRG